MTPVSDQEVEQKIHEFFDSNFETLKLEGGHALTADVKRTALMQVILYWRKLRSVAEKVTDTEVKLNLPSQHTPHGREFGIEGVVDIVRENDRTVMYDIKTHNADAILANTELYERQLNVYAHIWQNLHTHPLDETAVICTQYPNAITAALRDQDERRLEYELKRWNPLIDIPFNEDNVQDTIEDFGRIVDEIEDGQFAPPPIKILRERAPGAQTAFAVQVCRNCDARFSCESYREYVRGGNSRGSFDTLFRQYLDDFGTADERDEVKLAALSSDD